MEGGITYLPSDAEAIAAFKALRLSTPYTRAEIAAHLGTSDTTLKRYETRGGRWLNPVRYLRFLMDFAQNPVPLLDLFGIAAARPELDPRLGRAIAGAIRHRESLAMRHLIDAIDLLAHDLDRERARDVPDRHVEPPPPAAP